MELSKTDSLGIALKSSAVVAVRVNASGAIVTESSGAFDREKETLPQLVEFLSSAEADTGSFESFGLAVPGLVDISANTVVYSSQIPEHERVDLAEQIFAATGKRAFLENDANAAAHGEMRVGAGRDAKDLFYVTVGAGVGGALILDRKLWHGASGFAGEFGYVAVDAEGLKLEDVASSASIVRRAKNRLHQDPASSLFEIGEEKITYRDIIDAAIEGDGLAELILERTGMFLGTAIAGVINLLSIEKIIVGGPLMRAGDLVLNSIKERAASISFEPCFEAAEIERAELGEKASSVGAALLGMNRVKSG